MKYSRARRLSVLLAAVLLSLWACSVMASAYDPNAAVVQRLTSEFFEASNQDRIHYIALNTTWASDSFLIESEGVTMLVDTGNPDPPTGGMQAIFVDSGNVNCVADYLYEQEIGELDYVVLTHNHSDHIGGVQRLVERGYIGPNTTVYYRSTMATVEETEEPTWDNRYYIETALAALESVGANTVCLQDEGITELTVPVGNFSVEFLNLDNDGDGVVDFHTENENFNSIVLKVTKGTVDTLLTADIELENEQALLECMPDLSEIEVLKAPHHGSTTSSCYEFLKAMQPESVIVTSFRYRQGGAYEYLQTTGSKIYTTSLCTGSAIVENVFDDYYTIKYGQLYLEDGNGGWLEWFDHFMYIEDGKPVLNGWKEIDHARYYFDDDGIMQTGWLKLDGKTYYLQEDGKMAIGRRKIDGHWYTFWRNGELMRFPW